MKTELTPRPDCCPGRGSIWEHPKSQRLYRVITVARHSETPDRWLVVYGPLWDEGDDWVRSLVLTPENKWPGFLDVLDVENEVHRFRYVAGARTWEEGEVNWSPIGALAILSNEAKRIEEIGPVHEGFMRDMELNPNYRRLLRVVAAAIPTLFEKPVEIEAPAESEGPTFNELLEMLDNVSAAADNMMTKFGGQMYRDDARARSAIVTEARTVCDGLLRP